MALRTVTVLDNNVALVAGAGNHTSGLWTKSQLNTDAMLLVKLTNGTAPGVAAQFQIQVSSDNSNWFSLGGAIVGDIVGSSVNSWTIPISDSVNYIQVVSGSNTTNNVTIRVEVIG